MKISKIIVQLYLFDSKLN